MDRKAARIAPVLVLALFSGCTHVQLRKNTINQASTVSDVHLQQVMNNLAMFAYDPNSLPHFSYPSGAVAGVTDQGGLAFGVNWISDGFDGANVGGDASRSMNENFTMVPISDPHKLALMRCAYQNAIYQCGLGQVSTECPECEKLLEDFYKGPQHAGLTQRCLDQKSAGCWLHVGCKKDVPKHCPCQYVGEHCGTYVWVDPAGTNELVKLSLAILDFALYEPPQQSTRQIVRKVDRDANGNVTAISETTTYSEPIPDQYNSRRRSPTGGLDLLQFNQQLQTVQ